MKCHYLPKSPHSVLKVVLGLGVAITVLAPGSRPASGSEEVPPAPAASATQPSTIPAPGVKRGAADGPSGCQQRRGIIPTPPAPSSNPPAPPTTSPPTPPGSEPSTTPPGSGSSTPASPPGDGGSASASSTGS